VKRRERLGIDRILAKAGDDGGFVRHAHLDGVERRAAGLLLQRGRAAVEELPAPHSPSAPRWKRGVRAA